MFTTHKPSVADQHNSSQPASIAQAHTLILSLNEYFSAHGTYEISISMHGRPRSYLSALTYSGKSDADFIKFISEFSATAARNGMEKSIAQIKAVMAKFAKSKPLFAEEGVHYYLNCPTSDDIEILAAVMEKLTHKNRKGF